MNLFLIFKNSVKALNNLVLSASREGGAVLSRFYREGNCAHGGKLRSTDEDGLKVGGSCLGPATLVKPIPAAAGWDNHRLQLHYTVTRVRAYAPEVELPTQSTGREPKALRLRQAGWDPEGPMVLAGGTRLAPRVTAGRGGGPE